MILDALWAIWPWLLLANTIALVVLAVYSWVKDAPPTRPDRND